MFPIMHLTMLIRKRKEKRMLFIYLSTCFSDEENLSKSREKKNIIKTRATIVSFGFVVLFEKVFLNSVIKRNCCFKK